MENVGAAWAVAVLVGMAVVYCLFAFIFYSVDPEGWGLVGRSVTIAVATLWVGAVSWLAWRRYAE